MRVKQWGKKTRDGLTVRAASRADANSCKGGRRNENGYIVVETIGAFIPFVLLIISILTLVNVVTVQARVHYALTQAANTLSMYSYTLEVLGIADNLTTLSNKSAGVSEQANAMKNDINAVLDGVNSLSGIMGSVEHIGNAADRALSWGEEAVGDPKGTLQLIMDYGVQELRNAVFEALARPLVGRYLSNGGMTGDEYLRSAGVINRNGGKAGLEALDFFKLSNLGQGNSVMIDANGNVRLTVEYEILYTFGGLPLPFRPSLRLTQTVITKAWLNGSGKGYW